MMTATEKPKQNLAIRAIKSLVPWLIGGFIVGTIIGFGQGFFDWETPKAYDAWINRITSQPSATSALAVGGILWLASGYTALGALLPKFGMKHKMFADHDDWQDQRKLYWLSAAGCAAWGGLLVVLAISSLFDRYTMLAVSMALVAVLIWAFWQLLVQFDELWNDVSRTASAYAFYATLLIGGLWSGLAHLGFLEAIAPLGWLSLLTALSLGASIIANGRRGLLDDHI